MHAHIFQCCPSYAVTHIYTLRVCPWKSIDFPVSCWAALLQQSDSKDSYILRHFTAVLSKLSRFVDVLCILSFSLKFRGAHFGSMSPSASTSASVLHKIIFNNPQTVTASSQCCACVGGKTKTTNCPVQSEASDAAMAAKMSFQSSAAYVNSCDCLK